MTNWQVVDMLVKDMIHILGRMEQKGERFHHITQNSVQFRTYEFFISEMFHLIFSDCCWTTGTDTMESETASKGFITTVLAVNMEEKCLKTLFVLYRKKTIAYV